MHGVNSHQPLFPVAGLRQFLFSLQLNDKSMSHLQQTSKVECPEKKKILIILFNLFICPSYIQITLSDKSSQPNAISLISDHQFRFLQYRFSYRQVLHKNDKQDFLLSAQMSIEFSFISFKSSTTDLKSFCPSPFPCCPSNK